MEVRSLASRIPTISDLADLLASLHYLAKSDFRFVQMAEEMDSPFRPEDEKYVASQFDLTSIDNHSIGRRQDRRLFQREDIYSFMDSRDAPWFIPP